MNDQPQRDIVVQMQRMFNAGVKAVLSLPDDERNKAGAWYANQGDRPQKLHLAKVIAEQAIIDDLVLPAESAVHSLTPTCRRVFDEGAKAVLGMPLSEILQSSAWHENPDGLPLQPRLQEALVDAQERLIAELLGRDADATGRA